jgi:hypothetical protein
MLRITYVFYQLKRDLGSLNTDVYYIKFTLTKRFVQLFSLAVGGVYVYATIYVGIPHCKHSFTGVHRPGFWAEHYKKLLILFYMYSRYLVFYYTTLRVCGQC